jgi:hypothetical protein
MRDSFVFYRSFWDAIKKLNKTEQADCLTIIFNYVFYDILLSDIDGVEGTVFTLIKPLIDKNNNRYDNGKKGGRPPKGKKPNDNQTVTKAEPNVSVSVSVSESVDVSASKDENKTHTPPTPSLLTEKSEKSGWVFFDPFISFNIFWTSWKSEVTEQPNGKSESMQWFKDNCTDEGIKTEDIVKSVGIYGKYYRLAKESNAKLKPLNAANFLRQYTDWLEYVPEESNLEKLKKREKELEEQANAQNDA